MRANKTGYLHSPASQARPPWPLFGLVQINSGQAPRRIRATVIRGSPKEVDDPLTAPVTVLRLLTPLKMPYETAKKRAEPYTKIVEELPEMWRDTLDLVKRAVKEKRQAYIIVNNRSEGNAPLTIQALLIRP